MKLATLLTILAIAVTNAVKFVQAADDASAKATTSARSVAPRVWSAHDGRKAKGHLLGFDGSIARIRASDGTIHDIPASRLSLPDQEFLAATKAAVNASVEQPVSLVQPNPPEPPDPRDAFLELLEDDDIQAAMKQLKEKMTKTVVKESIVTKTVWVPTFRRCGLFGHRRKRVMVRRTIQETVRSEEQVTEGVEFAWDTITDQSKGYATKTVSFAMLPKSVGAKTEFVLTQLNTVMPTPYLHGLGAKTLTARTTQIVDVPDQGVQGIIAVMVRIQGQRDDSLLIAVAVQNQAAAQAVAENERDAVAKAFAAKLAQALEEQTSA